MMAPYWVRPRLLLHDLGVSGRVITYSLLMSSKYPNCIIRNSGYDEETFDRSLWPRLRYLARPAAAGSGCSTRCYTRTGELTGPARPNRRGPAPPWQAALSR